MEIVGRGISDNMQIWKTVVFVLGKKKLKKLKPFFILKNCIIVKNYEECIICIREEIGFGLLAISPFIIDSL